MSEPSGNVTAAAPVALALVRAVLREVPGVVALVDAPSHSYGRAAHSGPGAVLLLGASGALIDCAVIAARGVRLVQLAATAQAAVSAALRELAGIQVATVNISIEDIALAPAGKTPDHG